MKSLLIVLFSLSITLLSAQTITPIDTSNFSNRKQLIESLQNTYKEFNSGIKKKYRGKKKKEYLEIYEFAQEQFIQTIEERELILDRRILDYTEYLSEKIKSQIADIRPFKLHISRSYEANAFCLFDGTMVLHAGLLNLVDNEEQLLSVLCHELAHNELSHSQKAIHARVELSNSETLKKNLKELKKNTQNRNRQAFSILKGVLYAEGKQKRHHELQADSLGLLLFSRLSGRLQEYPQTMVNMMERDSLPKIELVKVDYNNLYNLPSLPFNEDWLKTEDLSKYNYKLYRARMESDSIKSHPEMEERVQSIQLKLEDIILNPSPVSENTPEFRLIKKLLYQEISHNLYITEEYAKSIYYCMLQLKRYPSDEYAKMWIGRNYARLYEIKKAYEFNKFVPHVSPKMTHLSYRKFLSFLWNLELNDIKQIAIHYGGME